MGGGMRLLRAAAVGVVLWIGSGSLIEAQISPVLAASQQPSQTGHPGVDVPPIGPTEPLSPQVMEQQARARNSERQKKLVEDTDKLLVLATQLKEDVGKTNKDVLSVDVVKKADEIEKLAHSVKERMKG
jgi:hypothetical protein